VSLTSGRGPFSGRRAGRFTPPLPEHAVYVEPLRRRVRGMIGDRVVIDSEGVLLVHRPGHAPSYAFPAGDVADVEAEPEPDAPGHVQVGWDAVDAWFEEEEEVFLHPRNPYHRVDYVPTRRRLRVEAAGTTLVDTEGGYVAYETALEPVLYVSRDVVRMDLLLPTATTTYCPYKGTASYWSAVIGDVVIDDVAWSYEDPRHESELIRDLMSFDVTKAAVEHDIPLG
jgi:uncharacterized protein (DUF427 family)